MTINVLDLPTEFVASVEQGAFRRTHGSWELRQNVDAWGLTLETNLAEVYEDTERILAQTKKLSKDFPPNAYEGLDGPDPCENMPGFVPYITDFSRIVCFGVGGENDPFCFDYRESLEVPEVIWWEDAFWRRVAPDWAAFIALFDLTEQVPA